MSIEISNFIDGKRVAAADGRTTDLIDPSTGDHVVEVASVRNVPDHFALIACRRVKCNYVGPR